MFYNNIADFFTRNHSKTNQPARAGAGWGTGCFSAQGALKNDGQDYFTTFPGSKQSLSDKTSTIY
jgi:hypothetical protein